MFPFIVFNSVYLIAAILLFYNGIVQESGTGGLTVSMLAYMLARGELVPALTGCLARCFVPVFLAYLAFSIATRKNAIRLYYSCVYSVSIFAMILIMLNISGNAFEMTGVFQTGQDTVSQSSDLAAADSTGKEDIVQDNVEQSKNEADGNQNDAAEYDVPKVPKVLPEDKGFFGSNYVAASSSTVIAPEERKNIMLVFMESMEQTFSNGRFCGANLIPFLSETASFNISFDNYRDGYATNWTQASLVAAMTGIPSSYLYGRKSQGKDLNDAGAGLKNWMRGVYSIGEILRDNGYERLFVQGGSLAFSGTGDFLNEHGFKGRAFGTAELKEYGKSETSWGIEDRDIYGIFEDKLAKLPKDRPFFAVMATIDTHHYNVPDYAPIMFDMRSKDVIYYADSLMKDFLNWFYLQPYAKDTVLIIIGDHLRMSGGPKSGSGFLKTVPKSKRRIYNVFINASLPGCSDATAENCKIDRNRTFTQIDMFPTILEAAGFTLPNHRLGLGVSVFSEEKTLVEKYGETSLRQQLRKNSPLYSALWE